MIDENFYQKKVDELKKSLSLQTVFINESFSGGLFRTSAKDYLNSLSIYHLLRGLEIDTDKKTYDVLKSVLPQYKDIFDASNAEMITSDKLLFGQMDYVVKLVYDVETELSELFELIKKQNSGEKVEDMTILSDTLYQEILPILKENKKDFGKLKKSLLAIQVSETVSRKKMFENFVDYLKNKLTQDKTGLNAEVYAKIDGMRLRTLKAGSFVNKPKNYFTKEFDIEDGLTGNSPIERISMFFEIALNTIGIPELTYMTYDNNAYDFLELIITNMTASSGIKPLVTPVLLSEYKDLINKIGEKLINPKLAELTSIYSQNITIPSIQTLYISLLSSLILKLINYNYEAIEFKEKKEREDRTKVSPTLQKKYVEILNSIDQLKSEGFFDNKKVFYERKVFSKNEQRMITILKTLFFKMGIISNFPTGYLERGTYDRNILGEAVKKFQNSLTKGGRKIQVDGRIGKDTRSALLSFGESLRTKI